MKPEDLQLLVSRTMPFGKHKGVSIADLPGNYLNWFAREGFPPGEIGQLLHHMGPVVGDRVARVMPEFFGCLDRKAARTQALEQDLVSAGRKTVGVGKNDQRHGGNRG